MHRFFFIMIYFYILLFIFILILVFPLKLHLYISENKIKIDLFNFNLLDDSFDNILKEVIDVSKNGIDNYIVSNADLEYFKILKKLKIKALKINIFCIERLNSELYVITNHHNRLLIFRQFGDSIIEIIESNIFTVVHYN